MSNLFKQNKPFKEANLHKSAGILDDYAIRKVVSTREGTITKTPVNTIDITNKNYVDGAIDTDINTHISTAQAHTDYLLNTGDTATGNYTFDILKIDETNHALAIRTNTSAPADMIEMSPILFSSDQDGAIRLSDYGKNWSYRMAIKSNAGGVPRGSLDFGGTEVITISNGQLVGIGNIAPAEKLDVTGNINTSGIYKIASASGYTGTVTTASLVGKTITISGGIITGFA